MVEVSTPGPCTATDQERLHVQGQRDMTQPSLKRTTGNSHAKLSKGWKKLNPNWLLPLSLSYLHTHKALRLITVPQCSPFPSALQFIEQSDNLTSTSTAQWVPQCYCSSQGVDLLHGNAQLFNTVHSLERQRERFHGDALTSVYSQLSCRSELSLSTPSQTQPATSWQACHRFVEDTVVEFLPFTKDLQISECATHSHWHHLITNDSPCETDSVSWYEDTIVKITFVFSGHIFLIFFGFFLNIKLYKQCPAFFFFWGKGKIACTCY